MTVTNDPHSAASDLQDISTPSGLMSENEFETWVFRQEQGRYEWVDGTVAMMSPASYAHDDLDIWLSMLIRLYAEEKVLGVVCSDVMFRMPGRRRTPDVMFIHKDSLHRLSPTRLEGPPDLAIEIVSPRSEGLDWRDKYLEYQAAGVKEYWIIDPRVQAIECFSLNAVGTFCPILEIDGKITSTVLPGLYLRTLWLWQTPLPSVLPLLREMGLTL